MELLPVKERKSILRGQDRRLGSVLGETFDQGVYRLTLVRREPRDVDERRHVGVVSSLGDHGSAVGMSHKDHRFALRVDDALGRIRVALERERRILDDADLVTVLLQLVVDALPAGAVDKTSVNEDNVL